MKDLHAIGLCIFVSVRALLRIPLRLYCLIKDRETLRKGFDPLPTDHWMSNNLRETLRRIKSE